MDSESRRLSNSLSTSDDLLKEAETAGLNGKHRHWTNTIFLQVADPKVDMALSELINEAGCYSYTGRPGSPDILAVPCFAFVVDRNVLGRAEWRSYLEFRQEVVSMDLCIVSDNLLGWELPSDDLLIKRMQLNTYGDANKVFEYIMQHRQAYINRQTGMERR